MGLSEYDHKKAPELRLQNGDGIDSKRGIRKSSRLNDPACGSQPEATSCCQPDRNGAYCQNPVLSEDKVCAMPTWYESWEREDTYAAIAVLCAAISVGVAYSCCKQMRSNGA
ncbi:hypothetical protein Nepgr_021404 [Nepenthes gracilis]|uniref:Uncharacterized protein n=1 Tax=Nepenthes gracilis TaxID=150966 RepID=A0AAD3SWR6_NEPGR|nr:hypothetical protein Nepgr_021404 [Nepenthes gracilis]